MLHALIIQFECVWTATSHTITQLFIYITCMTFLQVIFAHLTSKWLVLLNVICQSSLCENLTHVGPPQHKFYIKHMNIFYFYVPCCPFEKVNLISCLQGGWICCIGETQYLHSYRFILYLRFHPNWTTQRILKYQTKLMQNAVFKWWFYKFGESKSHPNRHCST